MALHPSSVDRLTRPAYRTSNRSCYQPLESDKAFSCFHKVFSQARIRSQEGRKATVLAQYDVCPVAPSRRLSHRERAQFCPLRSRLHSWVLPTHSPLRPVRCTLPVSSAARSAAHPGKSGLFEVVGHLGRASYPSPAAPAVQPPFEEPALLPLSCLSACGPHLAPTFIHAETISPLDLLSQVCAAREHW